MFVVFDLGFLVLFVIWVGCVRGYKEGLGGRVRGGSEDALEVSFFLLGLNNGLCWILVFICV